MTEYTYFEKHCKKYTKNTDLIQNNYNSLHRKYSEKHRYYHNLNHISKLLSGLEQIADKFEYTDDLIFAIWYHDVIYNPLKKNNEEKSADYAMSDLTLIGYPEAGVERVAHIIRRTKNHFFREQNESVDLQLMLDLDLQTLGSETKEYDINTKNIRMEYKAVPEMLFRKGRKDILKKFLEEKFIYRTSHFRQKREEKARINLKAEVDLLNK